MTKANGVRKNVTTKTPTVTERNPRKSTQLKKTAMIKQLALTLGNIGEACKLVGIDRSTHREWMLNDPDYKQQFEDLKEDNICLVKGKLYERIVGYEHAEDKIFMHEGKPVIVPTTKHYPPDPTSIIFFLKTQAKHHGFVERQEIVDPTNDKYKDLTESEIDERIKKASEQFGK